jgi:tyrosinase
LRLAGFEFLIGTPKSYFLLAPLDRSPVNIARSVARSFRSPIFWIDPGMAIGLDRIYKARQSASKTVSNNPISDCFSLSISLAGIYTAMHLNTLFAALAILNFAGPTGATPIAAKDDKAAFLKLQHNYEAATKQALQRAGSKAQCNQQNVVLRRSWDDLGESDRAKYIKAVKCLANKPTRIPKSKAPGAVNRLDDYTYIHINQTNFIHISGLFLTWHRKFIWSYEKDLRDECGYTGYLPYWDWSKHAHDQSQSPVFSGGPTGFGGNGKYIPHQATNDTLPGVPEPVAITRDAGSGGGCIKDGAFKDFSISLGPVAPANNPPSDPFGLRGNPRCLKRDFLQEKSGANLTYATVAKQLAAPDFATFRLAFDLSVHKSAHEYAGGDLYDFYSSPNDPVFFLLHSQLDRLWTIWQAQDYDTRTDAMDGTETLLNLPPSANVTLDTKLKMGVAAGGDVRVGDTTSAIDGPYFCYMYA